MNWGDKLETALTLVGVTSDRVSRWLGYECNCKERRDKLNRLGSWVARVLLGKTEKAEYYLDQIMEE